MQNASIKHVTTWQEGMQTATWDRTLSAEEIAALAAGVSPLLIRPEALVFYQPLLKEPPCSLRTESQN